MRTACWGWLAFTVWHCETQALPMNRWIAGREADVFCLQTERTISPAAVPQGVNRKTPDTLGQRRN